MRKLVWVVLACLAFSCGKNKGQPPPDVIAQDLLVLELLAPPNGSDAAASVCLDPTTGNPPQAWVVEVTAAFEIESARNTSGGWDESTLIFVYDDEGRRNCAQNPCNREWIPRISATPSHVRVEGTREDPDFVGDDNESFNVLCRGETLVAARDVLATDCIVDASACDDVRANGSGTGATLLVSEGGYPPVLAEQTPELRRAYNARVRMLAVGQSNPVYDTDPFTTGEIIPWLVYAQASPLSTGQVLVTGGTLAPGNASSTFYLFDPTALRVTELGGMLGGPRAAHTAVNVALGGTAAERIWLVGGASEVSGGTDGVAAALNTTILYDLGVNDFTLGPLLSQGRALADVHSFTWNTGGNDHQRALVSGGYTTSALSAFGVGEGTSASAAVFSGEVGPDIVETLTSTAGRAGSSVVLSPDGMSALVVGGYSQVAPADAVNCTDNSATNRIVDCADQFDPAGGVEGAFGATALAVSPAASHSSTSLFTRAGDTAPSASIIAGGVADRDGVTGETAASTVTFWNGTAYVGALALPEARARATTVNLDDGTVLMIGGGTRDAAGLFTGVSADTAMWDSAGFDGVTSFGAIVCDNLLTDSVLPDCPQLQAPRVGHASARLSDGAGWLEGSVLIVGGANAGFVAAGGPDTAVDPAVALFVPAYTCVEELIDDEQVNHPPDAVGGGQLDRCEIDRRFTDDGDIYRNGPEP